MKVQCRSPRSSRHTCLGQAGTGAVSFVARRDLGPAVRFSSVWVAEACDIPVRWSCRTGVICESVLIGTSLPRSRPARETSRGNALICCSRRLVTDSSSMLLPCARQWRRMDRRTFSRPLASQFRERGGEQDAGAAGARSSGVWLRAIPRLLSVPDGTASACRGTKKT